MLTRRQLLGGAGMTAAGALVGGTAVALNGGADPQALLADFIAKERAYNRRRPLIGNPGLQAQAELQALRLSVFQPEMRAGERWVHSPAGEQNWWVDPEREGHLSWFGEVVAATSDASELGLLGISRAWMASLPHQVIVLRPEATLLGVGVREAGGRVWCTATFGAF